MSIFKIIKQNLGGGSRTHSPAEVVPRPERYRGMILHDANRCTGCGTCAYVCSPSAINIDNTHEHFVSWEYFAGQCTYCGRCVAFCPTGALRFDQKLAPVSSDVDSFRVEHHVEYKPCSRCGKQIIPLPGATLLKLYGDPLPADIVATRYMCEECRNKVVSKNLMSAVTGRLARRGSDYLDRKTELKKEQ